MAFFTVAFAYIQAIALIVNGAAINDEKPVTDKIPEVTTALPPFVPNGNPQRPEEMIPNIANILGAAQSSFPDMSTDDLRKLIAALQQNINAIPITQDLGNPVVENQFENPTLYSNGPDLSPQNAVPQINRPVVQQSPVQNNGCNTSPHETDPTRFLRPLGDGRQIITACAPGTVYNEVLCRCDWAGSSFAAGNGIVNVKPNVAWQTKWSGKCRTLMSMSFDNGVKDDSGFYTINHGVRLDAASDGISGRFDGTSYIEAAVFTGNELGDTVDISFRFKSEENSNRNQYEVLLSNECKRKWLVDGFLSSSLAFKYNPVTRDFRVGVETISSALDGSCTPVPNSDGWFEVDLTLEQGVLSTSVNGQTCFTANVQGPISNKQCALGIGKSLTDDSTGFTGLIDENIGLVPYCNKRIARVSREVASYVLEGKNGNVLDF